MLGDATDFDGCVLTASASVEEPEPLGVVVSASEASCGGSDGSISLNVTGGTGNGTYSFVWDSAPNVEDPTGLPSGLYNVTVTDQNGCDITASATISVPDGPVLDFVNENATPLNGNYLKSDVLQVTFY